MEKEWNVCLIGYILYGYLKRPHSNHDHNLANGKKIRVCWTKRLTKTLEILVIMIGCTDLNSFRKFSRADKLRFFFPV